MTGLDIESLDKWLPIVIIMATLKLLFEIGKVYKSYQDNRYYSLDKLKSAFETERLDSNLKQQLISTYEREVFYKVYKIDIHEHYRRKVINISKNSHDIRVLDFKKAKSYITYKDSKIYIIYNKYYYLEKIYNKLSSYIYYILSVALVLVFASHFIVSEDILNLYKAIGDKYIFLILGLYFFIGALLCIKNESSINSLLKLKRYSELHQNELHLIYKDYFIISCLKKIKNKLFNQSQNS